MTETQETIVYQVRAAGIDTNRYTLVSLNENAVRFNKGRKNVDITYQPGPDLYKVEVHKINGKTFEVSTETFNYVYCDALGNFF